jgi:quercetin dioxygenase-like cupin family protein
MQFICFVFKEKIMEHPKQTPESMSERVVRFQELKNRGIPLMFIDSILPGHWRMNYSVVGDTASENPDFSPALPQPHTFQIGMGWAPPGCGPAWHTHDYVEMFVPLKGQWRFVWGNSDDPDQPDGEFILDEWDVISFPPGVWRRFENASEDIGWFFAVLDAHKVFEGKDPYWPPKIVKAAEEFGFHADEKGKMVKPDNYAEMNQQHHQKLLEMYQQFTGKPL